jgi:dephospho-CoA kinase
MGSPGRGPGRGRAAVTPRRARGQSPLVGLVGPIGCGKSTVAVRLAEHGAVVIDADLVTRELMAPGQPLTESIVARFGPEFVAADGSLDRSALGRLVFSRPDRLAELEVLVHPFVRERILQLLEDARRAHPVVVVLEAIKLIEAGYGPMCDEVWLVTCEPPTQLARLVARGLTGAEARQRIAAQVGQAQLWQEAAARVIRTDGSLDDTRLAVDEALGELTGHNWGANRRRNPAGRQ